jgi:cytochrome c556
MRSRYWAIAVGICALGLVACENKVETAPVAAEAVAQRQDLMKDNGAHAKAISEFVENGKGTAADVKMHAEALQANAKRIPSLFPAGTSAEDMPNRSYAKADIWTKWPEFEKAAYELEEQAEKLAAVAETGDAAAIKVQFASLGKNACGACHQAFRLKKE